MGAARTGNVRVAQTVRQALADPGRVPFRGGRSAAGDRDHGTRDRRLDLARGRQAERGGVHPSGGGAGGIEPPAPPGLPAPIKPGAGLLGEVLIEIGRPGDAIAPFESVLRLRANRSLSVLGLARAAARPQARRRWPASGIWNCSRTSEHADARKLAELPEARGVLDRPAPSSSPSWPSRWWTWALLGGGVAVSLVVASAARLAAPGACSQAATGKSRHESAKPRQAVVLRALVAEGVC